MGNNIDCHIDSEEIRRFSKPGISPIDLNNMKKAFILLDKNNTGTISYDVKKLSELDNVSHLPHDPYNDGHMLINYEQFMDLMTSNIIMNREKFGKDNIVFESETSNVFCVLCPYRKKEVE